MLKFYAVVLWLALVSVCAPAQERVLGKPAALPDKALTVELLERPVANALESKLELKLNAVGGAQSVQLESNGAIKIESIREDAALQISPLVLNNAAQAALVTFGINAPNGITRSVVAVLIKADANSAWVLGHDWTVECGPLGELGFTRIKQQISVDKDGQLHRQTHRYIVEGMLDKLDCGCNMCLSRTTEFYEDETFAWNAAGKTLDRTLFEKRYAVQPGEGLLAVARKALSDARLMGRLYRLNPELKPDQIIKEGQKILVERTAK